MIISKKIGLIFMLLLMLSACSDQEDTAKAKIENRTRKVEVITTSYEPVSQQQTVSGTLKAATSVGLYNEEKGRITELPYYEGDLVEKGDTVIKLDGALIQAELDKAIAEHKQAKVDLDRVRKLVNKKLASDDALAQAQTALDVAIAEEKLQRTRFQRTHIKAPFSGVITERNNEVGDVVAALTHVLSMIDPASLHIEIQLSENWLALIDHDSPVVISLHALGNTEYAGKITRIHPTIDPDTRKGTIEVTFQSLPEGARAGQLARIKIKSRPEERILVPMHALRHDANGAYLYIANDENKAVKQYVSKGLQLGDNIEITEGLLAEQKVIVKGFTYLRDKTPIQIISQQNEIQ